MPREFPHSCYGRKKAPARTATQLTKRIRRRAAAPARSRFDSCYAILHAPRGERKAPK